MAKTSLEDFYKEIEVNIPSGINNEIGHFNVFRIEDLYTKQIGNKSYMAYNRRNYYKISLIKGRNRAEYADKVIDIETSALLFASPKIPYHYLPQDSHQSGSFCIFTDDFFAQNKSGHNLDQLPIFQPNGYPVFQLSEKDTADLSYVFEKIHTEINSDYAFKYDLLRTYISELIHFGQKLQPATASNPLKNAAQRVTSLFIELLERQFPIESSHQRLELRTAKDYADRLAVHVNHLNKVLKESTDMTTTKLINNRVLKEAKILLRESDWNISEIAFCLGFEEVAHFSNFFKKQTKLSPNSYRG